MRTLLIGADGQLGRELLAQLALLGPVVATTRSGRLADGSAARSLDLRDEQGLRAAVDTFNGELVVNAAAHTAVDAAESQADEAFAVNAAAPGIMAEACARRGVHFVHFSTDYVFADAATRPLREDDPVGPLSVYGNSKLAGEKAVRAAGGEHKIFRLGWVHAAQGNNFVRTIVQLCRQRPELRVVADQWGCPTPATWIAQAVARAVVLAPQSSGIWNVAAVGHTTWHGFAEAIVEDAVALGLLRERTRVVPISTAEYPTAARRPRYSVLDTTRYSNEFGRTMGHWRGGVSEVMTGYAAAERRRASRE